MLNHSPHMPDNHNSEVALALSRRHQAFLRQRPQQSAFSGLQQPAHPFKIYPTLEPSPLPAELRQTGVAALSAISEIVPAANQRGAGSGSDRPTALPLRRNHPAQKISRRRNLLPRRRLHRSALRGRALSGLRRSSPNLSKPASITLPPLSSACARCAPETIAAS